MTAFWRLETNLNTAPLVSYAIPFRRLIIETRSYSMAIVMLVLSITILEMFVVEMGMTLILNLTFRMGQMPN